MQYYIYSVLVFITYSIQLRSRNAARGAGRRRPRASLGAIHVCAYIYIYIITIINHTDYIYIYIYIYMYMCRCVYIYIYICIYYMCTPCHSISYHSIACPIISYLGRTLEAPIPKMSSLVKKISPFSKRKNPL